MNQQNAESGLLRGALSFLVAFSKKEPVLMISAVCTLFSMLFVPPDAGYLDYLDFRVLILLFCLMAVVAGIRKYGLFSWLAQKLLAGERSFRSLFLLLILLPFFSSMLVTNDVALLTFVPFTILVLSLAEKEETLILTVVLQTIAANLGSMLTPVGNPQNLYLYSRFSFSAGAFLKAVLPYGALSLAAFILLSLFQERKAVQVTLAREAEPSGKRLCLYVFLFFLCILSVFHVLPEQLLFLAVTAVIFLADRELLGEVDYMLLWTFVCFFLFAGNIGRIPAVAAFFGGLMQKEPLLASATASQIISNVPAAVLLSGFTENGTALLLGTNLGGLGTPVASLASLISLRFYGTAKGAKTGDYLKSFLFWNGIFLAVLLGAARLLGAW